jgi:hypothetical protein
MNLILAKDPKSEEFSLKQILNVSEKMSFELPLLTNIDCRQIRRCLMTVILPDQPQIDPRAVWLAYEQNQDSYDLLLKLRETGGPITESLPWGCGKLPSPFSSRFSQQKDDWRFSVPQEMSINEAIEIARRFGFRTGPEDVTRRGDPGYTPLPERREKVVSARRRQGRPGEAPVTVSLALEAVHDSNGFVKFHALRPEEIPSNPPLHSDHLADVFLTDAPPQEVETAWHSQGFVGRDDVVSCYRPDELFVGIRLEDEDDDDPAVVFVTRGHMYSDDELRDHSLVVLPAVLGENISECEWALRAGVDPEQALTELTGAGFHLMPEDMHKKMFG